LKKYSVLNSITGLNVGGAEVMLARFASSLRATAFAPQVLSLMAPGAVADLLAAEGIPIRTLDLRHSGAAISAVPRLRKMVFQTNADLLHGWMYHGNLAASLGGFLDRRQSVPVVWSIHHSVDNISVEKPFTRWIIRLLGKLSRTVAAISYCSRVSADQHEALGFDPSKRVIIPNGIDCEVFRPRMDARQRLHLRFGIPEGRMVIGNVARAHPMKDHSGFVRTLGLLRDSGLDVHGIIVGAGHEDGRARQVANELGLADRLTTPGALKDIPELLPGIDAFMLSSAWGEAFPLSAAEAMACGVPVVATNVGDCGWLVGDPDLITPPRDPVGQAMSLRRIFALQPDDRRQLGLQGRHRVIENFSLRKYTEDHLKIYDAAMAGRNLKAYAS
jgi:glycosyltransferase involved in cell wall biosynthesis